MALYDELHVASNSAEVDDYAPTFYVGQHESKRVQPVTEYVLEKARNIGETGVG